MAVDNNVLRKDCRFMKVEGVEGISNYYAFVYNRNTGKIFSDDGTDDGFADFYNNGQVQDGVADASYTARKAGIDNLINFFSRQEARRNFFNSQEGSDEGTVIIENTDNGEIRYYVNGSLLFTEMPGRLTSSISFAEGTVTEETEEKLVFDDVSSFSVSDADVEEKTDPKRKTGTYSQVITYPDGSRYLITTMYFCGKEIKITKRLPPLDEQEDEDDGLLRQAYKPEETEAALEEDDKLDNTDDVLSMLLKQYQPEDREDVLSMLLQHYRTVDSDYMKEQK